MATIPRNRQIHKRLLIGRPDGQTWVDVADYLSSIEIELGSIEQLGTGTGTDIGVRSATFELRNVPGKRFAPRDRTSPWNQLNGEWAPLLWPYREVVFQTAVTAPGASPAPQDWITIFEGYMGDSIVTESHKVTVSLRDKSKLLQDTYIDVKKTYEGPISAEDLIQAIINDYITDAPPSLFCPVPSGITFEEMTVEYVSVWDAIQNVAKQIGWYLGYRWNGVQYVLAFIEPPRDKTTHDFELDWEDVILNESLDIGDSEIRNALTITFQDASTGELVTLRYTDYPQLRNEASISEYRLRAMEITEKETSLIDSVDKALRFGELCIWDLSELSATNKITLPYMPEVDVFSTLRVTNPLVSSTSDFYAVQSVRHTLRFGDRPSFRTEVIATGRVVGARKRWLDMETRPGRPGHPSNQGPPGPPGEVQVPKPANPVWSDYTLTNTLHLRWRKAEFASGYEIRTDLNWGELEGMIFRGYAHSFNFIPIEREMILYLRALNAIGEYSEGYDTIHVSLPAPEPPQQPTVEEFFSALRISPTPLNSPSVMGYYVYVTGDGIDDKITITAGGSLTYPLPSGTTVTIQVSAYDILGEGEKSAPVLATTKKIDSIADFAQDIIPPRVVNVLPDLPDANFPEGSLVYLTSDGKLYKSTGDTWATVETQIGEGDITETLIADNSISTPKLKANAVTSDKIAANAITADKIAANAITAGKIAAGAVGADEIAANAITAEKVGANEIITTSANIRDAVIDDAKIINIEADKITTDRAKITAAQIESIEASQITVGGQPAKLVNPKPEGGRLWHFDRSVVSTDGIQPESGAVYTLRPNEGKFGGAVAVEEGTTNLVENGDVQTLSKWGVAVAGSAGDSIILTFIENDGVFGDTCAQFYVEKRASWSYFYYRLHDDVPIFDTTKQYTLSFYAKGTGVLYTSVKDRQSLYVVSPAEDFNLTPEWRRYTLTFTPAIQGVNPLVFWELPQGNTVRIDGLQLEVKPYATSFVDGTRAAGRLEYPQSIWNPSQGTFSCWVKTPINITERRTITLQWGRDAASVDTRFGIEMLPDGRFTIHYGSADTLITSNSYNDGKWHFIALTWIDGTSDIHFFVDGQKVASANKPITLNVAGGRYNGVIPIGHRGYNYRDQWWNGLIDELLILPYAATEEEIQQWYNSGAPFVDSEEVVSGGRTIINSEGLKAYDSKGNKTVDIGSETGDAFFRGAVIGAVYNE